MKPVLEQLESRDCPSTLDPVLVHDLSSLPATKAAAVARVEHDFTSARFAGIPSAKGTSLLSPGASLITDAEVLAAVFASALAHPTKAGVNDVRATRIAFEGLIRHAVILRPAAVQRVEMDSTIAAVVMSPDQVPTYDPGPGGQVIGTFTDDVGNTTTLWVVTYTNSDGTPLPDPGVYGLSAPPPGTGTNGATADSPGAAPQPMVSVQDGGSSFTVVSVTWGPVDNPVSMWVNPYAPVPPPGAV